jgi:pentatricopeptide repeat protein
VYTVFILHVFCRSRTARDCHTLFGLMKSEGMYMHERGAGIRAV